MKKLLSVLLVICLMAILSVTAFAAEINQGTTDKTGGMQLEFTVASTYIVTIPAEITLAETTGDSVTYEQDYTLTANGVCLKQNEKLQIKIASDFKLKAEGDYELPYTVTKQGETTAIVNNGVVATFDTDTDEQTQVLHFTAGNPTYAGEYSDTVTFTIVTKATPIN